MIFLVIFQVEFPRSVPTLQRENGFLQTKVVTFYKVSKKNHTSIGI